MLFQEQGITINSILMVIRMAIDVLVEPLHPGGSAVGSAACKPLSKHEKGERIRNKLKAVMSLLGRLRVKTPNALPGIIGIILSWTLKRAADVVGWVSLTLSCCSLLEVYKSFSTGSRGRSESMWPNTS